MAVCTDNRTPYAVQLAFPCNAFGKQEPGSCSEIQHFAEEHFNATFPIFNKVCFGVL
jgi:glutathione peroxidase-family protein